MIELVEILKVEMLFVVLEEMELIAAAVVVVVLLLMWQSEHMR
jgi:hypothetical protein